MHAYFGSFYYGSSKPQELSEDQVKELEDLQEKSNKIQVDESSMPKSPLNLDKPSSSVSVVDLWISWS